MNRSIKISFHMTAILMLSAPVMSFAQPSEPEAGELIIRGGWLFDGVSDTRRRNSGIVIRNGKIVDVDADVPRQTAANVIDLQDSETILPGLIDLHAHYNLDLSSNLRFGDVVWPRSAIVCRRLNAVLTAESTEVRARCKQARANRFTGINQITLCYDAFGIVLTG